MHVQVFEWVARQVTERPASSVLEIGSLDINGSVRPLFASAGHYHGLDIVAGRLHDLAPRGTEGAWFDWSVGDSVARSLAGGAEIMRPIFEPGDAILFDDMNLHRTAVTPEMTHERYAIESWFFAPSHYPDAQIPVTF